MSETKVYINGQAVSTPTASTVAAALLHAGVATFRQSATGEARGPVCGMGVCYECHVTVDGAAHTKSCQTVVTPGMRIATAAASVPVAPEPLSPTTVELQPRPALETDVLVVGGGPAGMAAAVTASRRGRGVVLVDDNAGPGGNIWRGEFAQPEHAEAAVWFAKLRRRNALTLCRARILGMPERGVLLAETADGGREIRYKKLILATGARERFLPFPGWTRPNVMGAGGLQALVKGGLPVAGRRVVVAGTGPLLLAVAAFLKKQGAEVVCVAEQASRGRVLRFGAGLWRQPGKLRQGLGLRRELKGVELLYGTWPVRAEGGERLEIVTLRHGRKEQRVSCDYLACGWHLVPNVELPLLLGCAVEQGVVTTDEWQQTSVGNIYCAGETTGIGGVELALIEGQIAGYAAIERYDAARTLFGERDQLRKFAQRLNETFALRAELKTLAAPDTLVCRCEDVSYERLAGCRSWREAKLHTRCGMGPCQGRICGGATEFLFDWNAESARPPVFPARLDALS